MVVMLEGELYGVTSAGHHAGGGQQGSAVFARVKALKSELIRELRLHPQAGTLITAEKHLTMKL